MRTGRGRCGSAHARSPMAQPASFTGTGTRSCGSAWAHPTMVRQPSRFTTGPKGRFGASEANSPTSAHQESIKKRSRLHRVGREPTPQNAIRGAQREPRLGPNPAASPRGWR
jgi:hypothetical protein